MLMNDMSKTIFANRIYSPLAVASSSNQLVRRYEIVGAILSVCESLWVHLRVSLLIHMRSF